MKDYGDFIVKDNRIIIKDHVKHYKPITGTKIGAITGDNPFSSPFVIFMDLFRFALPFETSIEMETGIKYEPVVIDYVNKTQKTNFTDYTSQMYYDFDVKKGIGAKFNGKLDGWDDEKKIVLEVKVTNIKNREKWIKNNPPLYYILQMLLYAHLTDAKQAWLCAYFIKEEEYDQPIQPLEQKRLKIWKIKIDQKWKVKFNNKLTNVEEFINNHLKTKTSPPFDAGKICDRELLDHLGIQYDKNKGKKE